MDGGLFVGHYAWRVVHGTKRFFTLQLGTGVKEGERGQCPEGPRRRRTSFRMKTKKNQDSSTQGLRLVGFCPFDMDGFGIFCFQKLTLQFYWEILPFGVAMACNAYLYSGRMSAKRQ